MSADSTSEPTSQGATVAAGTAVALATSTELASPEAVKGKRARDLLTPAEIAIAEADAAKLNVRDVNAISVIGAGAQKQVGDYADKFLDTIRLREAGSSGTELQALEATIRGASNDSIMDKIQRGLGKVPIVGHVFYTLDGFFDSVREEVDEIVEKLMGQRDRLFRENAMFDIMAQNAITNRRSLLVQAAGCDIAHERGLVELPRLESEAKASGDPEKALDVQLFRDGVDRLDLQATFLDELAYDSLVSVPQLRILMAGNLRTVQGINTACALLVPAWKRKLAIKIGIQHQEEAVQGLEAVKEAARRTMVEAAEQLHDSSVAVARTTSSPLIGDETFEKVTELLLSTITDVRAEVEQGARVRADLRTSLAEMNARVLSGLADGSTGAPVS